MAGKAKSTEQSEQAEGYVVVQPFADIANFDLKYEEGQDVSHLTDERLLVLMEKGLVKEAKDVAKTGE